MPFLFNFIRGEWFLVLLVFCVAIGLPIVLIGVVVFTLRRNRKNVASWQKLSKEIGFQMPEPGKLLMRGTYNGIQTTLRIGSRSSYNGERRTREFFTYCTSYFPQPLRFALQIVSPPGMLRSLIRTNEVTVGNQFFDKKFSSVCYNQRVLQRLLLTDFPEGKTANLMGELLLAKEDFGIVKLIDEKVYIEIPGQEGDHETLKKLLATTNRVTRRFAAARAKFPSEKWELAFQHNWSRFASASGLNFDANQGRLIGNYKGFPLDVSLHCEPGRWLTTLHIQFPESLMIGLNIFPEISLHKVSKLFGFQDIKTGHKEFDDAFIVKAENVVLAKAKMTPDFCTQMIGLDKHTHNILLDDNGLKMTLTQVLGDENALKSYLAAMVSTMEKLR